MNTPHQQRFAQLSPTAGEGEGQQQSPQVVLLQQPFAVQGQQGAMPIQLVQWNGEHFIQAAPQQPVQVMIPQSMGQGQQVTLPQYYLPQTPQAQYPQQLQSVMVPVVFDQNTGCSYIYTPAPSVPLSPPPMQHQQQQQILLQTPHAANKTDSGRKKNSAQRHEGSPLMEQFRHNKHKNFELSELRDIIPELLRDQEGSRYIQRKIESENCTPEDMQMIFDEVIGDAFNLMTDVFGNYVIQKLLEYGSPEQRKALIACMKTHVLQLTLHTYGCRVAQKALEFADEDDQVTLARELDGFVLRCVLDQNGNHVIQKCIERSDPRNITFIVSAFVGNVQSLAVHAYGCRVIQRILEYCEDNTEVIQPILDEILATVNHLVRDQYGNYVVQHVVINGKPLYQYAILERMRPEIVDLAQHKFASNVIEKLLQYCDAESRRALLEEFLKIAPGHDVSGLIVMMKDQYANYVVQKLLEVAEDNERKVIIDHIKPHIAQLRKYTYGKHIIARIEKGHTTFKAQ